MSRFSKCIKDLLDSPSLRSHISCHPELSHGSEILCHLSQSCEIFAQFSHIEFFQPLFAYDSVTVERIEANCLKVAPKLVIGS